MGLLGQVLTGVVASRMGRGMGGGLAGFGGGLGGFGGPLGGVVLGGMGRRRGGSPVMQALLLLLAAKAAHGYMQRRQGGQAGDSGMGGLLGGVAGGGGLGALVDQFTRAGHGEVVNSWITRGPNQKLPPNQLAEALGPDTVEALEQETGMDREALLSELSEALPEAVDQLSPEGVPPDPQVLSGEDEDLDELSRAQAQLGSGG